jgi:hypothetical protein
VARPSGVRVNRVNPCSLGEDAAARSRPRRHRPLCIRPRTRPSPIGIVIAVDWSGARGCRVSGNAAGVCLGFWRGRAGAGGQAPPGAAAPNPDSAAAPNPDSMAVPNPDSMAVPNPDSIALMDHHCGNNNSDGPLTLFAGLDSRARTGGRRPARHHPKPLTTQEPELPDSLASTSGSNHDRGNAGLRVRAGPVRFMIMVVWWGSDPTWTPRS